MNKLELHFETAGTPAAPALMLLHGFMSSNGQWLMNVDDLAEHFFLVMVELWGHGQSPTPEAASAYSIDSYLQQFEHIRDSLNIQRWSVGGQSYGAGLIVHYAIAHPERVDAVIVTNSRSAFGRLDNNRSSTGDEQRSPFDRPDFDNRTLPYHPIHARRFPQHVKQALVHDADNISARAIKYGGALGGQLHCVEKLAQVEAPILLTNGIYEKSFQSDAENLRGLYAGLRIAGLQGGHSVNIEAADEFNQAVLAFLKDQQTRVTNTGA